MDQSTSRGTYREPTSSAREPTGTGTDPERLAVGLDVGGTKIAGGVVDAAGAIVERLSPLATPGDQEGTLAALTDQIGRLRARHPAVGAVGVGAAGLVDWPAGRIRWAPNNAYRDLPLRHLIESRTGLPTVVDNDANAAAWAQARLGPPAAYLMLVTVGTGIGGGLVLDGRLFRGSTGIGAEIGHTIVDPNGGWVCGCGRVGCLEAVASGTALGRYGREAAALEPAGAIATIAAGAEVTGEIVFAAAQAGDATARTLFGRLGDWLGIGLASLDALLDVELIVVGGGVARAGDLLLGPTRESFERHLFARDHRRIPQIMPASLGVEAGWVGAAVLALERLAGDDGTKRRGRPAHDMTAPFGGG